LKNGADKAFMIGAYFDSLDTKIAFLKQLHQDDHRDEALILCCCYTEALGSQKYPSSDSKAKNYAKILEEEGGNPLFSLVHPRQLVRVLDNIKLFTGDLKK